MKNIYKVSCPLCTSKLEVKELYDGVREFKCVNCGCKVQFKSWEQQGMFTGK